MNAALCASDTSQHELTRMPAAGSLPSTMILWKQTIEMERAQHPHKSALRLTKTTDNYSYAFPAALALAHLAF